eukprot:Blabericola_migrator_1__5354@NODE_2744_length_2399_cov_33_951544_g1718_i0_p1_GENE_NODE_2744_length_2399_cov_33_951544_g1718_i0NODE_2744_length_2399_cov_33_951544_g1718_i0_p1_ORF_typecomplete_len242_score13_25Alg14/PF08660_11/6_3e03Alg14/PF08660_11/0_22_NODE_2744_length_2399_cov_33_951544_g1718_i011261851
MGCDSEGIFKLLRNTIKRVLYGNSRENITEDSKVRASSKNVTEDVKVRAQLSRKKLCSKLTEPQFNFLYLLEPFFAALTITPHPLPEDLVESTLALIRLALLRHHMLIRLSTVTSMSDNIAAQYCAALTVNCRQMPKEHAKHSAAGSLYEFVRAPHRQQVAQSLLEAFTTTSFLLNQNICFIVAVDFVGREDPNCPLQWEDIRPLFDSTICYREHHRLVSELTPKLKPYLIELAASPLSND